MTEKLIDKVPIGFQDNLSETHQTWMMVKALRDDVLQLEVQIGKIQWLLEDNKFLSEDNQKLRGRLELLQNERDKKLYYQGIKDARAKERASNRRKKPRIHELVNKRAGSRSKKGQ